MALVFGFDIGATSIGFAVIDYDPDQGTGKIRRLGVRIFPEARDPKAVPLNQDRRAARMRRLPVRGPVAATAAAAPGAWQAAPPVRVLAEAGFTCLGQGHAS